MNASIQQTQNNLYSITSKYRVYYLVCRHHHAIINCVELYGMPWLLWAVFMAAEASAGLYVGRQIIE